MTRLLLYIFLSCVLRLSQIFPTMFKSRETLILFKGTVCFIWSPVALTSGRAREWGRKSMYVTNMNKTRLWTFLLDSCLMDFLWQWWLFNNENNYRDPTLLASFETTIYVFNNRLHKWKWLISLDLFMNHSSLPVDLRAADPGGGRSGHRSHLLVRGDRL